MPFGTFTGDDSTRAHWLYHRKFAQWMHAQWPASQAGVLAASHNCGLPAVGPAFATLCLHSLLPPAPDLITLEYAINVHACRHSRAGGSAGGGGEAAAPVCTSDDVQWFELLLRKLLGRFPRAAIVVINTMRLGKRSGDDCESEQSICESFGAAFRAPAGSGGSSAERAIEAVSAHYGVPVVSLRRAIGPELGAPPFFPSNFLKDCAHPNPLGHSWLAQLLVHAVRTAAAAADSSNPAAGTTAAAGSTAACEGRAKDAAARARGRVVRRQECASCTPAAGDPAAGRRHERAATVGAGDSSATLLPPPLYLRARTAALGGNSSACYHGEALHSAVVRDGTIGFSAERGRKPGLAARSIGAVARIRVRLPEARTRARGPEVSTWVHLGYLQSWRSEMGAVTLVCEPPCACTRERIEAYDPQDRTSVTKIRPFRVQLQGGAPAPRAAATPTSAAMPTAEATECVLRLTVAAGAKGGSYFVVRDLITGSPDPGPLTWAFDVAGSLLLHARS